MFTSAVNIIKSPKERRSIALAPVGPRLNISLALSVLIVKINGDWGISTVLGVFVVFLRRSGAKRPVTLLNAILSVAVNGAVNGVWTIEDGNVSVKIVARAHGHPRCWFIFSAVRSLILPHYVILLITVRWFFFVNIYKYLSFILSWSFFSRKKLPYLEQYKFYNALMGWSRSRLGRLWKLMSP